MPENILILADWRLAGLVDDTVPPTPTAMMTRKKRTRRRTRERSAASRQGNPNPTNSPHPLYEAYAGSAKKTRPTDPTSLGHSGACR
jgi:hypothetical protein